MSLTSSTMSELGAEAPDFALPDTSGAPVRLSSSATRRARVARDQPKTSAAAEKEPYVFLFGQRFDSRMRD